MTRVHLTRRGAAIFGLSGVMAALATLTGRAEPVGLASDWAGQKAGRVRLLAGMLTPPGGAAKVYAGVQIVLDKDWKTYWRQPGEAGVPPGFDWAGSTNVADARVLYPVPQRLPEAGMTSLGYKREVVFPVEITPKDPAQPVGLKLAIEYGVCKDICIPAEAKLALTIPAASVPADGGLLAANLARVPTAATGGPTVTAFQADLAGASPKLIIEATFPKGSDGADVLIEVPGGELAPLPVVAGRKGPNGVRFESVFATTAEAKRFAGKPLLLTLFTAREQAEARAQVP